MKIQREQHIHLHNSLYKTYTCCGRTIQIRMQILYIIFHPITFKTINKCLYSLMAQPFDQLKPNGRDRSPTCPARLVPFLKQ